MTLKYYPLNDQKNVISEAYISGMLYHLDSESKLLSIIPTTDLSIYYMGIISDLWVHPAQMDPALFSNPKTKIVTKETAQNNILSVLYPNGVKGIWTLSKDNFLLKERDYMGPGASGLATKTIYADFVTNQTITFPHTISWQNINGTNTFERVARIKEINFNPKAIAVPDNFGLVDVKDSRFSPSLDYTVRDHLPANDVLVDIASDPQKLSDFSRHATGTP